MRLFLLSASTLASLAPLAITSFHFNLQAYLLRDHIYKIESIVQAGLGRIIWQSLNIADYCGKCKKVQDWLLVNKSTKSI